MLKIGLILSSPSPHQVELLDAIAERADTQVFAGYVQPYNPARTWGRPTPNLPWENLPTNAMQICKGALHRWFAEREADIWLLSSVYTNPVTHLVAHILKTKRQPFAFLGEPPQPRHGFRNSFRHKLMMSIISKATAVIGTGLESARRYKALTRPDQAVHSVPYYVDMSKQLAAPPVQPPGPDEPFRFVASAQLIHRKGLDVLIKACRQLPENGWTLDIFGDGPLRTELTLQAQETAKPVFIKGSVPYEEKDRVFSGRHCFVFSTRWDGWGMVLPEALAMGLPVITTDQAMSAHDFIRPGINGQIGPADDDHYLARAMMKAMERSDSLEAQSIAAKQSLSDYSPRIGADKLVDALRMAASKAA